MITAQHITKKDRHGNPLTKTLTDQAWRNLHDPNWIEAGNAPAPLKSVKEKVSNPKKTVAKKKASGKK